MRSFSSAALVLAVLTTGTRAHATVDAFVDYTIAYAHPQSDDVCLASQMMLASLGIPGGSVMKGTFAPTKTLSENAGYVNINLVATTPPMVPTYVFDDFDGAIWEYGMEVDVRALAAANGTTVAGRRKTLHSAKLALITMAEGMARLSGNRYRLYVTFVGLPWQADLGERRLYPRTYWPYTATSLLLNSYRAELVNVGGSCP